MDLRQLTFFVTVAEIGNFTRASEQLHVAQPAISVGIRKLEDELGLRLLNRQAQDRQVTPTAEGLVLLGHARAVLAQVASARREMAGLRGLERGEVQVGIPTMLGAYRFPSLVAAFRKRHPGLRLTVPEEGARSVQHAVATGQLALGIVAAVDLPEVLETMPLSRVEMVACVPQGHALARKRRTTPQQLAAWPLILFPRGYYQRELLDQLLAAAGPRPQVACETNLVPLMKQLVIQGAGCATLLRDALDRSDRLVAVPFEPPLFVDVAICWKRGRQLSRAEQAFVEFLTAAEKEEGRG